MRNTLLLLFCWLCSLAASGDSTNAAALVPASTGHADSTIKDAVLITSFPFKQYYGGVVVIHALLNGIPDTLQFILDTGSAGISLDTGTCDRLGIPLTPSDRLVRGLGGAKQVSFAMDR